MATDILGKLDNKKPFRSVEIPDELLENILLIPTELGPCLYAPIIKVERKLSCGQVEEMMAYEEEQYKGICHALGVDVISPIETPTFKDTLIRKDLSLLCEIVATNHYSKIRRQKPDWSNLYQMVEIDWSIGDFHPVGRAIHYEVFTKREIFIRTLEGL